MSHLLKINQLQLHKLLKRRDNEAYKIVDKDGLQIKPINRASNIHVIYFYMLYIFVNDKEGEMIYR